MSRISWPAQHLMAVARVRRRCPVTSRVVRSCSGSSVQIASSQQGLNSHVGVNAMVRGSDEPGPSVVGNGLPTSRNWAQHWQVPQRWSWSWQKLHRSRSGSSLRPGSLCSGWPDPRAGSRWWSWSWCVRHRDGRGRWSFADGGGHGRGAARCIRARGPLRDRSRSARSSHSLSHRRHTRTAPASGTRPGTRAGRSRRRWPG